MRQGFRVGVIIPARNEAVAIRTVLTALPDWLDEIVVVDNGSTDDTAAIARACGARVIAEP